MATWWLLATFAATAAEGPSRRQPALEAVPAPLPTVLAPCADADAGRAAIPIAAPLAGLFDVGVVDADGDGKLDIFTCNHNDRQGLLLGDGAGGFRDVAAAWGLGHEPAFPGWELPWKGPPLEERGLFVHRERAGIVLRLQGIAAARVVLDVPVPVRVREATEADVTMEVVPRPLAPAAQRATVVLRERGRVHLRPVREGVEIRFAVEGVAPRDIRVGPERVAPASRLFALQLRDRHGMAWSDVDGDGRLDVFASRGGLKGLIAEMTPGQEELAAGIEAPIEDELLLATDGGLVDRRAELGLEKGGCRTRDVSFTDVDGDGDVDLSMVCEQTPCHLALRDAEGCFRDGSAGRGLDQLDVQSELWIPLDDRPGPELVRGRADGLWLYRRDDRGTFAGRRIAGHPMVDWLRAADVDGDGDLDLAALSPKGVTLLRNDAGDLVPEDAAGRGLPAGADGGAFTDDGDGRPDLLLVPHGLYVQQADGRFRCASRAPEVGRSATREAFATYADVDGDGARDLLLVTTPPGAPPALTMRRGVRAAGHWLQVELVGPPGNPEGRGALVRAYQGGGVSATFPGHAEGSRHSQGHDLVYLELGPGSRLELLEVIWPDGVVTRLPDLPGDRRIEVAHPGARSSSVR